MVCVIHVQHFTIAKQCHNLLEHDSVVVYINDNIDSVKSVFQYELLISNY